MTDDTVITGRLTPRNPITVEQLPFIAKLYRMGWKAPQRRAVRKLVGKPAGKLFRLFSDLGVQGTGRARFEGPAGVRAVSFDGRNTQFSGIYLPQHLPFYESDFSALLDRMVGDAGVFYDVGANWGWYSVLVASRPGFTGQVHAFEPVPGSYADLATVIGQAGLDQLVRCHQLALGKIDGEVAMALPDGLQSGLAQISAGGGIKARIARLDSLDLPAPSVMKIDVEDHEIEVMEGAAATIQRARPFIGFESHRYDKRPEMTMAPLRHLAAQGFRLYCPGWLAPDGVRLQTGGQPPARPSATIGLVPLLPEHRFLMSEHLNLFAVPQERVDELRARLAG